MRARRVPAVTAIAVAVTTVLAGCTGGGGQPSPQTVTHTSTTTPATSASSRPRSISLAGLDPCSLLTPAQKTQLGLASARVDTSPAKAFNNAPACSWITDGDGYSFELITTEGISAWTSGTRQGKATPSAPINGFPTLSVTPPVPQQCYTVVDVADGQYLLAYIGADQADAATMCDLVHTFAAAGMATLTSQR